MLWKDIIPHNEHVLLESVDFTKDFMIVKEKENAQNRIKIVNLKTKETTILNPDLDIYEINFGFEDYDYDATNAWFHSFRVYSFLK